VKRLSRAPRHSHGPKLHKPPGSKSYHPPKGFEHVHHHWDAAAKAWIVQIMPGEYYCTDGDEIIATVLGSCVSTCMRDKRSGFGGMNHFMLPDDPRADAKGDALRYGCFAVERLLNELYKRGTRRDELEIKVFGGGQVIAGMGDIGRSNIEFVRGYLRDEGLAAVVEDVGGSWARRLRYFPSTGKVLVKHLPMNEASLVGNRERDFRDRLQQERLVGDVELF
jgi:chemotaxis protein CheD